MTALAEIAEAYGRRWAKDALYYRAVEELENAVPPDYQRDFLLVQRALLRRHDLDPDGVFDEETDAALLALNALCVRIGALNALCVRICAVSDRGPHTTLYVPPPA